MSERGSNEITARRREFFFTRSFDASRELVFKAYSESERLAQWWGPAGFRTTVRRVDFRPGGICHFCMANPLDAGMRQIIWGRWVYREIAAPERIVFVNSFSDENGGLAPHPVSTTMPTEVLLTLTFAEKGGKTTVIVRGGPINATEVENATFEAMVEGMQSGFAATQDKLAAYLSKVST